MKNKKFYLLILAAQFCVMLAAALWPAKEYGVSYGQEQLLRDGERGGVNTFYLNEEPSMGDSVYITTPAMTLDRGHYTITVEYESRGGGKLKAFYEDGWYDSDISGNLFLSEGSSSASFELPVRHDKRPLHIGAYQRSERQSDDYLLIRSISVESSGQGKTIYILRILLCFLVMDCIILIWNNKKLRRQLSEQAVIIAVFSTVIFLTSLPVFADYLSDSMLDIRFHLTRIEGLKAGLQSGAFPVRIQPEWLNGHGYAVSVFYGDLFLYFPALLRLAGFSPMLSYQCFVLAVNIATIWLAFYSFEKITKDRQIAAAAAILYTGNMYRMTAVYMRAAVGAYCAMIFLPLIVMGLYRLFAEDIHQEIYKKNWIVLAVGFWGVLMSHIISFEMAVFFTALICIALFKKTFRKETFVNLCKAAGGAVIAGLWLLVPFLDYMRDDIFINSGGFTVREGYKMQERGLFLPQIFSTQFEVASASEKFTGGIQGEMPMTIGLALTLVLGISMIAFAYKRKKQEKWGSFVLCSLLTIFSFSLTLHIFPYIAIAEAMPVSCMVMRSIQYTWRFLTISVLLICLLFCLAAVEVKNYSARVFWLMSAGLCLLCVIQAIDFSSVVLNETRPAFFQNSGNLTMDDVGGGEYLPFGTKKEELVNAVGAAGTLQVEQFDRKFNQISCFVRNTEPQSQTMELPLLYYRYYEAKGGRDELFYEKAENGRMRLKIPASFEGNVSIKFSEPILWRIAESVSLLSVILFVIKEIVARKRYGEKADNIDTNL